MKFKKFKPFSETYLFDDATLTEEFPPYLSEPVGNWMKGCMNYHSLIEDRPDEIFSSASHLTLGFRQSLQLDLRRTFPQKTNEFIYEVTGNMDLCRNVLAYILQKYCYDQQGSILETILRRGSSAYTVIRLKEEIGEYEKGFLDLGWYVPEIVKEEARELISSEKLLRNAWHDCYKLNPEPSACVSKCIDFLEGFLRDKYWPNEKRTPSIWEIIKRFNKDPDLLKLLQFKGDSFLEDKTKILSLLVGTSKIRSEHTTGEGRDATPEEAIFVLHTTIYIWNLMR